MAIRAPRHHAAALAALLAAAWPAHAQSMGQGDDEEPGLAGGLFRAVNSAVAPGARLGDTSSTAPPASGALPMQFYATFDNQGAPLLGQAEWGVGSIWNNIGGSGQSLSYQFTRSTTGRYNNQDVSWSIDLPWQDRLDIFGAYETEHPQLSLDDEAFSETDHNGQASLRYVHSFPDLQFGKNLSLSQDVQGGYDFKTTNVKLLFDGGQSLSGQAEIDQFPLIYDAALTDPYGATLFGNQLVLSPGGLTGANNNSAFKRLVPGSSASYVYDTIWLTRTTYLPAGFSWNLVVLGQLASHNLLYSEQLGLGGMDSVRGYYTNSALGSEGVLVSNEISAPAFSLAQLAHLHLPVEDSAQFGAFWDYGHVAQVRPIPDALNSADLSSVGLTLNSTIGSFFDLEFDIGWRLRGAPYNGKRGAFGDIALTVGY
jgi:hemolysin activation/secretion protein